MHGVDLLGYAKASARLASGVPRAEIIAQYGLDDARWLDVDKAFGLYLADAARRGDVETLKAFEGWHAEEQAACPAPAPSRPLAAYAQIAAALQAGAVPLVVCAEAGLTLPEFFALQAAWTRRLLADPALHEEYSRLVESALSG